MITVYLKLDVSGGRFIAILEGIDSETQEVEEISVVNIEDPGDLQASILNGKLTISSSLTQKSYFNNFDLTTSYKTRAIGSSSWVEITSSNVEDEIQAVLDRPSSVVVSDDEYNLSDFIKPDLTSGHSEATEFVHNGDIDNGGAVILDSNSALIGFQSGTFVKTTENIVQGRPYGRVQIKVDNGEGTGTAVDAIDILQGNVVQYPTITVSGEAVFAEDVEFQDAVILTSPNGTKYRLGVDNSGNLSTQAV